MSWKSNTSKCCVFLSTVGPLGYLPAPGTWGAAVGLLCAFFGTSYWWYPVVVVGATLGSWFVIDAALPYFKSKDPSEVILDEVVSCALIFVVVPFTLKTALIGFLVYRFFDITKWCGVSWFETLPGATGVLLDDCYAALLACGCVYVLVAYQLL